MLGKIIDNSLPPLSSGFNITLCNFVGKHPTRKYKVRFQAHPHIQWLAKFLPITPYVEAEYPDEADPIYIQFMNTLVCGPKHFDLLKRQATLEAARKMGE